MRRTDLPVFNIEKEAKKAIESEIEKFSENAKKLIEYKEIHDAMLRAIFSELSKEGWSMNIVTDSKLENNRTKLSGYVQWYQLGQKKTQKQFDEAVRELVKKANDYDQSK